MCRFPHLGWIYKSVSCHYKENSVRGQFKNDIKYQEKKSWIFTFWLEIPTLPWCCSHSSLVSLVSGEVAAAGKRKLCISGKSNCSHAICTFEIAKTYQLLKNNCSLAIAVWDICQNISTSFLPEPLQEMLRRELRGKKSQRGKISEIIKNGML